MPPSATTPARVSDHYSLGKSQAELDFVNVDIYGDTPVFVSPRALQQIPSQWAEGCVYLIQNFFETVITAIKGGRHSTAEDLLRTLREPNETHLGLSSGRARGRALGSQSAHSVWDALRKSDAVKTGLLRDLEDTVLMIDGIAVDIVSDITTNIIREPLIEYTQDACLHHGIPIEDVDSGPLWDPQKRRWFNRYEKLPTIDHSKLILVPKAIVRRHADYDAAEYLRHYLLEHLREVELDANSSLVRLLKDKRKVVFKKDVIAKYGASKDTIVEQSLKHRRVLDDYRKEKDASPQKPLSHDELAGLEGTDAPNWQKLLIDVTAVQPGRQYAAAYESVVEGFVSAMFYPSLTNPRVQHQIHDGRKRIDITYSNMGRDDFFGWLARHYPAAQVFVECKNYGADIGNPELDQLAGRFSPSRGKFGILICRKVANRALIEQRCKDTANDGRGYVVVLDDEDLTALAEAKKNRLDSDPYEVVRAQFDRLIN